MKHLTIFITLPLLFTLSACGSDSSKELFDACFEQGVEQGKQEVDQKAVEIGVTKACNMFVTECEDKPDSKMCVAVKTKFGVED